MSTIGFQHTMSFKNTDRVSWTHAFQSTSQSVNVFIGISNTSNANVVSVSVDRMAALPIDQVGADGESTELWYLENPPTIPSTIALVLSEIVRDGVVASIDLLDVASPGNPRDATKDNGEVKQIHLTIDDNEVDCSWGPVDQVSRTAPSRTRFYVSSSPGLKGLAGFIM